MEISCENSGPRIYVKQRPASIKEHVHHIVWVDFSNKRYVCVGETFVLSWSLSIGGRAAREWKVRIFGRSASIAVWYAEDPADRTWGKYAAAAVSIMLEDHPELFGTWSDGYSKMIPSMRMDFHRRPPDWGTYTPVPTTTELRADLRI